MIGEDMTDTDRDGGLPKKTHYKLSHYRQRFNWDCGISCILMILQQSDRQYLLNNFDEICEIEGFGCSTWTIDLCYLLIRFKIRHIYFTKTLGIDQTYRCQSYYQKIIDKDEQRVTRRFQDAGKYGINVQKKKVDINFILYHLAKYGPVILLTNSTFLSCFICRKKNLDQVSYAGHYVVLCGYDNQQNFLYYHNPESSDAHICHCSLSDMDAARKAYGTDEDIILIYA